MTHQYKSYQWQWKCGWSLTSCPGQPQFITKALRYQCKIWQNITVKWTTMKKVKSIVHIQRRMNLLTYLLELHSLLKQHAVRYPLNGILLSLMPVFIYMNEFIIVHKLINRKSCIVTWPWNRFRANTMSFHTDSNLLDFIPFINYKKKNHFLY